ncbi:MAG: UDP-3-O-acyl-N-acetylglucosamine deacetylase [Proteobacteria bacterium]|jgi:UDP-3-O-[3-hydroxymyristoyl] N-acetylglucosamine deacetylase|nr:UDP-3-O-acyl-N-acetylglucosamine deacetylase [Pseudomonadota bacterium]
MLNLFQKTISEPVEFKGIGLHSGLKSLIKILPAKENFGIIFKRTDLKEKNIIKASFENVSSAKLCTTIQNDSNVSLSTVEHLLAALYIVGIDNALIEINNSEVPIFDGSSKDFVETIFRFGVKEQNAKRKYLKILKRFEYKENKKFISIEPNENSLNVDFEIVYSNKVIGTQRNQINFSDKDLSDVYTSRTFCLFEDIEKVKKIGLGQGGSLDNAIVVKGNKILNSTGLRNSKEFVNHKILDLAGDFLLSGYRILGSVTCSQGGHSLSNLFLRNLLKDRSNYSIVELNESENIKTYFKTSIKKLAINV